MDEGHIDYIYGDSDAGIVNNLELTIDEATLLAQNEAGGESNVATGFHAQEFLLWGQDFADDGPGERPWTDYDVASSTKPNPDRRGQYLAVVSDLLVGHLTDMSTAWAAGGGNYRADFEAAEASVGLERILTGMIILSGFETGGERLQAALDSGDQEDEHSCFSDNTHRDMVQDVVGVQNVWRGSYTRLDGSTVSGTSIRDVVEATDADLASRVDAQIDASVAAANALQPPFDQEIALSNTEGRARVQALIDSLKDQETILLEVFTLLGLSVEIPTE
jgi:putative iron-regulated protein